MRPSGTAISQDFQEQQATSKKVVKEPAQIVKCFAWKQYGRASADREML